MASGTVRSVLRSPRIWYVAAFVLVLAGLLGPAFICLVIAFVTRRATLLHGAD